MQGGPVAPSLACRSRSRPTRVCRRAILAHRFGIAADRPDRVKTSGRHRHVITDCPGLLLMALVTAGNVTDRQAAHMMLPRVHKRFTTSTLVWADSGYCGRLVATEQRIVLDHRGEKVARQPPTRPAGMPKHSRPGPGRPPGSKNRRSAPRHEPR
ncbi:transposase [Streptomyces shenzhenensis]|uniref:transposase n=1 Tax=Streptomyces shenzhenensis TaxID=943815 RepID=UPI0033EB5A63